MTLPRSRNIHPIGYSLDQLHVVSDTTLVSFS